MREAANNDDHRTVVDTDRAFHLAIVKASGNRMLEHVWQTLRLSITTCVTHSVTHRSLHVIAERHVAAARRLAGTRDPERAEAAMRRHIEEASEWIVSAHREEQTAAQPASGKGAVARSRKPMTGRSNLNR